MSHDARKTGHHYSPHHWKTVQRFPDSQPSPDTSIKCQPHAKILLGRGTPNTHHAHPTSPTPQTHINVITRIPEPVQQPSLRNYGCIHTQSTN
eukprot:1085981-Rhodomonas_salina.1